MTEQMNVTPETQSLVFTAMLSQCWSH